jgi:hypothetical protein
VGVCGSSQIKDCGTWNSLVEDVCLSTPAHHASATCPAAAAIAGRVILSMTV